MNEHTESRTSASLLERLRLAPADQAAWAEFVDRYGRKIYGWSRHWGLQEADALYAAESTALQTMAHRAKAQAD